MSPGGAFVISLDFELYWGVRDVATVDSYRENLLGVRQAIPAILGLFERHGIHATWATVGMLFCRTKRELEAAVPRRVPKYADPRAFPYDFSDVGEDEKSDPFRFAPSLIERIAATPGQEVASHTFSHFYCNDPGQTVDDFDADMESARKVAGAMGLDLRSIVFPRNQISREHLAVLPRHRIEVYRSNGDRWLYAAGTTSDPKIKRVVRLADTYLPLAGGRSFPVPKPDDLGLVDVQASAFFRPYNPWLRAVRPLKIRRITRAISTAAKRGEIFHLWWHPHNFGTNLRENMTELTAIVEHFSELRRRTKIESLSMLEAGRLNAA